MESIDYTSKQRVFNCDLVQAFRNKDFQYDLVAHLNCTMSKRRK